ncbi:MAG: zinc ribbon domain-containing protein [Planctomycetota bacterium]|jgi:putative FmdB family regulatory protein|nr:zinc ribbon domain-containing protein [Planctomycetota bacterium]
MPLYEYVCDDCGEKFEVLTARGARVACEKCGGKKVTKAFSTFATATAAAAPACADSCQNFSASGCCGGHCHHH